MVTFLKTAPAAGGMYVEGFALSTDTLPIEGIVNGSKMEVLDASTGALTEYRYNATGGAWVAVVASVEEVNTVEQGSESVSDTPGGAG